jgi:hypothetical protein
MKKLYRTLEVDNSITIEELNLNFFVVKMLNCEKFQFIIINYIV